MRLAKTRISPSPAAEDENAADVNPLNWWPTGRSVCLGGPFSRAAVAELVDAPA